MLATIHLDAMQGVKHGEKTWKVTVLASGKRGAGILLVKCNENRWFAGEPLLTKRPSRPTLFVSSEGGGI